ncbi:MAG: hypothetical protein IRY89_16260 [Pseudolabrys sp.]|nr:hypothetical protein [Pseudolabrys sp.]
MGRTLESKIAALRYLSGAVAYHLDQLERREELDKYERAYIDAMLACVARFAEIDKEGES